MKAIKWTLSILVLFAGIGEIGAQKQINLDEIVVTGTGTAHNYKTAPVQTQVLRRDVLKDFGGKGLTEILGSLIPSFDFNEGDMGSGIQLDGLGNSYILILVDGKRMHGDLGGENDLSSISVDDIARIEVVKGASSSLYGSDAIAGVVNIITKKSLYDISVSNNTRVGSYGDVKQLNVLHVGRNQWESTTKFQFGHSDGWQNSSKHLKKTTIHENSVTKTANRYSNLKVEQAIAYRPIQDLKIEGSGSYYQKEMFRPCGKPNYTTYDLQYKSYAAALDAEYKLAGADKITASFQFNQRDYYHNYTGHTIEEYWYADDAGDLHVVHPEYVDGDQILQNTQKRFLAETKAILHLSDQHTLNAGLEYRLDYLKAPYNVQGNHATAYMLSGYAQDEWNITKGLNVTLGLRANTHKEFGFNINPKASMRYHLGAWNLRATYAEGFKTPTLKQMYYQYERDMMGKLTRYMGSSDLDPQTSRYMSAGIEYQPGNYSFSLTGYINKVDDMIALVETPVSVRDAAHGIERTMTYQNIEDAESKGFDALASAKWKHGWSAGIGYSFVYADGDQLNDDGEVEHIMLDGTSKHHANAHVRWRHTWNNYTLGMGLFAKSQSKRYYRYYGDTHGYSLLRFSTSHKLAKRRGMTYEAQAGIDNLLDYKVTTPYGTNYGTKTPGRTFYISLIIKFSGDNN